MEIFADVHERRSGVPEALRKLGAVVSIRPLAQGDYLVGDCAVERKSVPDLHLTIMRGRYWHQLHKLRAAARWSYLLIEGRSLWRGDGLPRDALRGLLLASSDLGVQVIRSDDTLDSASWILRIGARQGRPSRNRPTYAQRPRIDVGGHPAEQALAAAPGVSTVTARALLAHFGSLARVAMANRGELQAVAGVGRIRAEALDTMLHSEWRAVNPTSHSV